MMICCKMHSSRISAIFAQSNIPLQLVDSMVRSLKFMPFFVHYQGYLREELKHRIATSKSRNIPIKPLLSTSPTIAPSSGRIAIRNLQGSKVTMQLGQNTLGGITIPASLAGISVGKVVSSPGVAVSNPSLTMSSPSGVAQTHKLSPKKKKKKTSSSPVAVKKNIMPRTITVDATAASQLAGISPFLLPNTGNVFFSPFLAQQGVLQAAGKTVTITQPSATASSTKISSPTIHVVNTANLTPRKRTHSEAEMAAKMIQNDSTKDSDSDDDSSDDDYGPMKIVEDL